MRLSTLNGFAEIAERKRARRESQSRFRFIGTVALMGQAGPTDVPNQEKPWLVSRGINETTPSPSALGVNGIWNTTRVLVDPDETVRPALFVAVIDTELLTHTCILRHDAARPQAH